MRKIAKKATNISKNGFTLIELLIVIAIMAILGYQLITNFSSSSVRERQSLQRAILTIESQVRRAESLALAGREVDTDGDGAPDQVPCGYGLSYQDSVSYFIYAGFKSGGSSCSSANHDYVSGTDVKYSTIKIAEPKIELKSAYQSGVEDFTKGGGIDVFFEPPVPDIYIKDKKALNGDPLMISIGVVDKNCPANCRSLLIYPNGRIEVQ